MILSPWFWLGILLALLGAGGAGLHMGKKLERSDWQAKELKTVEKIVYRDRVINVEVPKIVTKVVEKRVEVEREVERVVTKIPDLLDPDCVLPRNMGLLLASAANGIDPTAPGGVATFAGSYRCDEAVKAILADYEAGAINTERLAGLQRWAELVTKETP